MRPKDDLFCQFAYFDVRDNTEDCTDGSDEEISIFSDSRAEKAEDSSEYKKLSSAEDAAFGWPCFSGLAVGSVLAFLSFSSMSILFSETITQLNVELFINSVEKDELNEQKKGLKSKINYSKGKLKSIKSQLKDQQTMVSLIPTLESEIYELHNINELLEDKKNQLQEELFHINEQNVMLWDSIRHLIPFGENI